MIMTQLHPLISQFRPRSRNMALLTFNNSPNFPYDSDGVLVYKTLGNNPVLITQTGVGLCLNRLKGLRNYSLMCRRDFRIAGAPLSPKRYNLLNKQFISYSETPLHKVFLSDFTTLLGPLSIIKRHFNSKKTTFPGLINPHKLGLPEDNTSLNNFSNKNFKERDNNITNLNLLPDSGLSFSRLNKPTKAGETVERVGIFKHTIEEIKMNSESHKATNNPANGSHSHNEKEKGSPLNNGVPKLYRFVRSLKNTHDLNNSKTGGFVKNELLTNMQKDEDKERGNLKSLYKSRSMYNYFLTTSGALSQENTMTMQKLPQPERKIKITPTSSLVTKKDPSQIKDEIYKDTSNSKERSYKIDLMNSREKDWKNLWINKFKKLRNASLSNYSQFEESIIGVKVRDLKIKVNANTSTQSNANLSNPNQMYPGLAAPSIKLEENGTPSIAKGQVEEKNITNKLLLSYLKQRKLNILNKHTFNTFLASTKEVNYSFSNSSGITSHEVKSNYNLISPASNTPPLLTQSAEEAKFAHKENSLNPSGLPLIKAPRVIGLGAQSAVGEVEGDFLCRDSYSFNSDHLNPRQTVNWRVSSLYKLLKSFFKSVKSLISYPVLNFSPNKIRINLFYYVKPTRLKIKEHKNYQKYIRKEGKLFKDNLLRSKFSKVKHRFNFILFLNKWKVIINNIFPVINPLGHQTSLGEAHALCALSTKPQGTKLTQIIDKKGSNTPLRHALKGVNKEASGLLHSLEGDNVISEKITEQESNSKLLTAIISTLTSAQSASEHYKSKEESLLKRTS